MFVLEPGGQEEVDGTYTLDGTIEVFPEVILIVLLFNMILILSASRRENGIELWVKKASPTPGVVMLLLTVSIVSFNASTKMLFCSM